MPTKKEIIADLDFYTSNLSTNVRTISLGVIAFSWALIADNKTNIFQISPALILALASVVCDFLQYYASYFMNVRLLKEIEQQKVDSLPFNNNDFLYRFKQWMFHFKLGATILSSFYLIAITFIAISKTAMK